jgi:hypothetical protein
MIQQQLMDVMVDDLGAFNDLLPAKKVTVINEDTIHNTILSDNDGFGSSTSASIYKAGLIWTIATAAGKKNFKMKKFPGNWLDMSVKDLASKFFMILMILCMFGVKSNAQLQLSLGAAKTTLNKSAISIAIDYSRSLDSIFKLNEYLIAGKTSLFYFTPEINILTGTSDAFSSIDAKLTGMFMHFKTDTVSGLLTPNFRKSFQVFPISMGIETNNTFDILNTLGEVGFVPYYQPGASAAIRATKIGVFLQGGYKFGLDSAGRKLLIGGQVDQSLEKINNLLFRMKGSLAINSDALIVVSGVGVGLVGTADVWYDFVNHVFYNSLVGKVRVFLTQDKFFDFQYAHGSGAPNFNKGDQYGVNLMIRF